MKKVNYFAVIIALTGLTIACSPKKSDSAQTDASNDTTKTEVPADPKLIAEGPEETLVEATADCPAYVLLNKPQVNLDEFAKEGDQIVLFDGKSFKGWRGYMKDTVPGRWIID
ncbi:MAG: DUF1080 domain-containing protein, partial [Bacteroidales bacterium]|nr:DUF1080 domain-containing protein [Bacteroidales bacterium]